MKKKQKIEFQINILSDGNEFWIETSDNIDTELLLLILQDAVWAAESMKSAEKKKKIKKTVKKGKKK